LATVEQKALHQVLERLRKSGEDWLRHRAKSAEKPHKVALGRYSALSESDLINALMHGGLKGEFDTTKVIFFEPPPKEVGSVAALWCRWDYGHELPRCGFYFGLWSSETAFPAPKDGNQAEKHVAFIGYRFETPEDGTNHNFYHAQPCRSMGRKDDEVEVALPVSSRMPTWPIAAANALELLLCLVAALYGLDGVRDVRIKLFQDVKLRANGDLRKALDTAIDKVLSLGYPTKAA
jgi:hypothetical protein